MAASVPGRAHGKKMAREALLTRLQAISQTARVLAEDTPGLEQQFKAPRKPTDQTLLTAGRKFARDAEASRSCASSSLIAAATAAKFSRATLDVGNRGRSCHRSHGLEPAFRTDVVRSRS